MKIFRTSGFMALLLIAAALGGGRPSQGAADLGVESRFAKQLEQTAVALRKADRQLGSAERGIARERENVAQLDRDLNAGAEPGKIIRELADVSRRVDTNAKSVEEVADSVAGTRARLVRILKQTRLMKSGVLARMAASQLRAADALLDRTDDAKVAVAMVRDSIEVLRSKAGNP